MERAKQDGRTGPDQQREPDWKSLGLPGPLSPESYTPDHKNNPWNPRNPNGLNYRGGQPTLAEKVLRRLTHLF